MVHTATDFHSFFFQHTHAGSGFASVEHASVGAFKLLHIASCHCGDTAHALHNVEHQTFGLEQTAHTACYHHGHIAGLHVGSVFDEYLHLHFGVETVEHFFGNADAGQDAGFLDEQLRFAHGIFRDAAKCGVVAITDIFRERKVNQFFVEFVYCIHNLRF